MNTITVEVTKDIAKKYWNNVVNYKDFFKTIEELLWQDINVTPKMKMEDFYEVLKKSDGKEMAKNNK